MQIISFFGNLSFGNDHLAAFESLHNGSWCNVGHIRIKDGKITIHFQHHGLKTEEKVPADSLRIRSRKANVSDCNCFLRPGVDVCVLLSDFEESLQRVSYSYKICITFLQFLYITTSQLHHLCNCHFVFNYLPVK